MFIVAKVNSRAGLEIAKDAFLLITYLNPFRESNVVRYSGK
jgi:hypothetical protein